MSTSPAFLPEQKKETGKTERQNIENKSISHTLSPRGAC